MKSGKIVKMDGGKQVWKGEGMFKTIGQVRKLIVGVIGFTILAIGVAMLILPGPALIVIPVGLAILATEFVWAQRLLKQVKDKFQGKKGEPS